jgi:glycosyltransferase involved in cell wall biosynthesis
MKRVLIAAPYPEHLLPGIGTKSKGHYATWLPQLARQFESCRDIEFHWLVFSRAVTQPLEVESCGQCFHVLPVGKASVAIITRYALQRRAARALARRLSPHLIHGWGTEDCYGYIAGDAAVPSILSMQGILQAIYKAAPQHWLYKFHVSYERSLLPRCPLITVESEWGRRQLARYAPTAVVKRIEYGVDLPFFDIQRCPEPTPVALYVGTISLLKGVDTLLRAFNDPRLAGVCLRIAGSGSVEQLGIPIPPNVQILGRVSPMQLRQYMAQSWCLVHPTRADTSPNCVKEARVIGLPVVTTDSGGQAEYVVNGVSGIIHTAGDVEGLIQGVLRVTESAARSLELGQAEQLRCREQLRPERTNEAFIELYRDMF